MKDPKDYNGAHMQSGPMPIVMDLGFGEEGSAGSINWLANKHTWDSKIFPGSGLVEVPTPACLLLELTKELKITMVRRCNLARVVETRVACVLLAAPS